ncbi:lytic transglycosylase domain-containing protein [Rhizobium sp. Root482]|uniref:lytic transglycosylase domain-containing protein n=1 Tax=Rhizobium sp. Root482 TaxID=1736543 RepID=UPI0009E8ED8D|nr:lytic transglycosylase domain-containing protein [Rhizobium sp. Root482]
MNRERHRDQALRHGLAAAILLVPSLAGNALARPERQAPGCLYARSENGTSLCIRAETYGQDICTAVGHFAERNGLPADFFARLIWKESLFRADAVSPKGAEGIAQFMPSTARMRGLSDSFDPLQAMAASAEYLARLRERFGNLGLAAAAYNAGETGAETFLRNGILPYETRAYVLAITAHTVEEWKDEPPEAPDLRLDREKSFQDGCVALAMTGNLKDMDSGEEGVWAPWGAQLAAHFQKSVARRLFQTVIDRMPAPLDAEKPLIQRQRNRAFGTRLRYTARIGRQTRKEAETVCTAIRKVGGACIVFRN